MVAFVPVSLVVFIAGAVVVPGAVAVVGAVVVTGAVAFAVTLFHAGGRGGGGSA